MRKTTVCERKIKRQNKNKRTISRTTKTKNREVFAKSHPQMLLDFVGW